MTDAQQTTPRYQVQSVDIDRGTLTRFRAELRRLTRPGDDVASAPYTLRLLGYGALPGFKPGAVFEIEMKEVEHG